MWIILGVFLSFSVLALDATEKLTNVKILRTLPDNIVQLNRGLEDGIYVNDHMKMSHETAGYVARGICVKASAETSYWRLYRIPESEAFSKDYSYTISGIADKQIPEVESQWRDINHEIAEEEKKPEAGPNPFALKKDLPEELTERDILRPDRTPTKLFVEQNVSMDQFQKDFNKYNLSVYASPFTKQSINSGQSLRYGFRGSNLGSKYRLITQFEEQQSKMKDPVTRETVSTRSTNGQAQFVIDRLTRSVSSLSLINYNSTRFSEYATPKNHWQIGVLGFTWHLHQSKSWEYMDLSYIPLYDYRTTEVRELDGQKSELNTTGLRHGFRLNMRRRINERVALENLLWVRPFQDMATWEIETDNLHLMNDLKLVVSITEKLFFDYNLVYQRDKLWRTLNGLPESNTINSLNLRYDFDL